MKFFFVKLIYGSMNVAILLLLSSLQHSTYKKSFSTRYNLNLILLWRSFLWLHRGSSGPWWKIFVEKLREQFVTSNKEENFQRAQCLS